MTTTTTVQLYPRDNNVLPEEFDSTADSLRRNSIQLDGTTLDLDSAMDLGDDLDDLIDGIVHNTTITTLELEGHLLCQLTLEDAQRLLASLGGLPALKRLHLHNYVAPLPLLTGLIEQAKTLEQITFYTAQLAGQTTQEGDDFATAIGALPCLETIKISNAIVAGGLSLERLVSALSGIWALQKVEIELERGGSITCPALRSLCSCPNLRELRLWRITLNPEHLILICNIVQHNHTIHVLELGEMGYADHTVESYKAVAEMVKQNSTMENFGMINFSGLDDEGAIAMADALKENSTLTEVNVRGSDNLVLNTEAATALGEMFGINTTLQKLGMNTVGLDDTGAKIIAQALSFDNNTTLQSLMLQRIVGDREKGYLALHDMLETNFTLHRIYPEAVGEIKEEMDFWLHLNQLGLRQIQFGVDDEISRNQFENILFANNHDLNVTYYLLSTNPDFLFL